MTRKDNPCYKCENRYPCCHMECEDYMVWKIAHALEKRFNEKLNHQYDKPTVRDKKTFDDMNDKYYRQKRYAKNRGECK